MNTCHKFKTTNTSVRILINSGAIACGYRLELDYFDPHVKHPAFISASLGVYLYEHRFAAMRRHVLLQVMGISEQVQP